MKIWQEGDKWLIEVRIKVDGAWETIQGIGGDTEEEARTNGRILKWVFSDDDDDCFEGQK